MKNEISKLPRKKNHMEYSLVQEFTQREDNGLTQPQGQQ
jgi:hypothetical protein